MQGRQTPSPPPPPKKDSEFWALSRQIAMNFNADSSESRDLDYIREFNWNPAQALLYHVDPTSCDCIVASGDTRSGKTFIMGQYVADCCLDYPGMRIAILAPVKTQADDTIWRSIKHGLSRIGLSYKVIETRSNIMIKCKNSTEIHLAPYEARGVDRLMGREFGLIIADEAHLLPQQKYSMLVSRLSGFGPRLIGLIVNPQGPLHWIKTDLIDKSAIQYATTGHSVIEHIYFSVYENKPNLPEGYIERMESLLTPNEIDRLLRGKWVNPAGAIFYGLTEDMVLEDFKVDKYACFGGVDFGFDHPFAYVKIELGWDGIFYITAEHRESGMKLSSHADSIQACDGVDFSDVLRFADHDKQDAFELAELGISSAPALKKDKDYNIKMLNRAIDMDIIRVFKSCALSAGELFNYHWNERTGKPVKEKDDLVDAVLYAIGGALSHGSIKDFVDKKYLERENKNETKGFKEYEEGMEEIRLGFSERPDSRSRNGLGVILEGGRGGVKGLDYFD